MFLKRVGRWKEGKELKKKKKIEMNTDPPQLTMELCPDKSFVD